MIESLALSTHAMCLSTHATLVFEKSSCDIEMDIYRLGFDIQDRFYQAVATNDRSILDGCPSKDLLVLWTRRQLASENASIEDSKTAEILRKYALYRYGGKFQIVKSVSEDRAEHENYQESLGCTVQRLIHLQEAAVMKEAHDDQKLLSSLEAFIRSSDIFSVAGRELVPMWSR